MFSPRRPLLPPKLKILQRFQCLRYSENIPRDRPVPLPTPFVPDHETFLKLIGRDLSRHASKIPSWEALFTYSAAKFRAIGIEPARSRKYLLRMRERFRQGVYDIGGDLQHVTDGVAEVRVFEVPVPKAWLEHGSTNKATASRSAGMRKVALNVPLGAEMPTVPLEEAVPVQHIKIKGTNSIAGKWVQMIKGTNGMAGRIAVREGLWEDKRGHKVDRGERRKAEVRSKRRAQERKEEQAA